MSRPQRTCPECGQGWGGHFAGCPEMPDEPEIETDGSETEQDDDSQDEETA